MDSTLAVQQYIQQTIRKDPQGDNLRYVRPTDQLTGHFRRGPHSDGARDSRRRCLEVRTPQTVLHGAEWSGGKAAG